MNKLKLQLNSNNDNINNNDFYGPKNCDQFNKYNSGFNSSLPELKSIETGSLVNKDIPGSTIDVAKKNRVR